MGLGRAQTEQAAPDYRLARRVGQLHIHQAYRLSMPQLVIEGLAQQQFDPPALTALIMRWLGQVLGTAHLVMSRHWQRGIVAVGPGDQGRTARGDQPHGGFEHLGEAHIEPDAARH